jgi:hypothetical protein
VDRRESLSREYDFQKLNVVLIRTLYFEHASIFAAVVCSLIVAGLLKGIIGVGMPVVALWAPSTASKADVAALFGHVRFTPQGRHRAAALLIGDIFEERGKHARSTIGVATLPLDSAVEVEATFEVD